MLVIIRPYTNKEVPIYMIQYSCIILTSHELRYPSRFLWLEQLDSPQSR